MVGQLFSDFLYFNVNSTHFSFLINYIIYFYTLKKPSFVKTFEKSKDQAHVPIFAICAHLILFLFFFDFWLVIWVTLEYFTSTPYPSVLPKSTMNQRMNKRLKVLFDCAFLHSFLREKSAKKPKLRIAPFNA